MDPHPRRWWRCPLDVETLARGALERVRDAARNVAAARGAAVRIETSSALIAGSFASYEHLEVDGVAPVAWAELSGFFAAADGWVRLHGNYPHHAAVLERSYGIKDRDSLTTVLAGLDAAEIEQEVTAAGGIAAAVRERTAWEAEPQHAARSGHAWAEVHERGERRVLPGAPAGEAAEAPGLLAGVRVLDLTRVIAGPTATQLLACLGADVLRIDPPHRPEILAQHLSTGMGKRSAVADLRDAAQRDRVRGLAAEADVIVSGYRPGALDHHGLGVGDLEDLAPQAVIAVLSAWGDTGPWGSRSGFDSIVQAASGIAVACGSAERPGALPVQALDHASGHLIAAHVLSALADARARTLRVSLLGAAENLLALPAPPAQEPAALPVPRIQVRAGERPLLAVPPPLLVDGAMIGRDVGSYGASGLDSPPRKGTRDCCAIR
ncbi:CoA transferase [Brachybacterium aquaticum]|uniref:CoA transferase n=1 Tax=Brachybacterium aquaticum TaxID=1432564 RepID=A0A841A758_9MICO|nr:CoA transferase [Brachybacterium aquaticum]MBB5830686.1 hypothetical protein [Brachybacterium aquaticum]